MPEIPILGITQETIAEVEQRLLTTTDTGELDDIARFTRGVNRRLAQEQPVLGNFLRTSGTRFSINDVFPFAYAAALTYEMIPQPLKTEPLNQDHTESAFRSMLEHVTPTTDLTNTLKIRLDWFVDDMRADSPDFMNWLEETSASLDEKDDQADFILGSAIVITPFFKREQSKRLEKLLWKEN